jgi:flagellin-like hook-associated protein FlgL
MFED